jgi:hypothetical protein
MERSKEDFGNWTKPELKSEIRNYELDLENARPQDGASSNLGFQTLYCVNKIKISGGNAKQVICTARQVIDRRKPAFLFWRWFRNFLANRIFAPKPQPGTIETAA